MDLKRTELQNKQAIIAGQRAEREAQKEKITSQRNLQDAQGELDKANLMEPGRERDRAVADAKAKLDMAKDEQKFSDDSIKAAQEETEQAKAIADQQGELAENALKAMDAQQTAALAQQEAAKAAKTQADELERADAAAKRLNSNAQQEAAARQLAGFTVGSKEWEQYQAARKSFYTAMEGKGDHKGNLLSSALGDQKNNAYYGLLLQSQGYGDLVKLADSLKDADKIKISQTMTNAQLGNKDVIGELQRLNENIKNLASRPSTLNVSTPNPTRDAASIYSEMSRSSVRSSNL